MNTHCLKGDIKKTLIALRNAGSRGIHSLHLNAIVGTTRSAARVNDLINLGYKIDNNNGKREKLGSSWGVRYTLIEKPPVKTAYHFVDGVAIPYTVQEKPVQESLL